MALSDDLGKLRDRVLADLTAVHDYYADTKAAWEIVDQIIAEGKTFTVKNTVTGTETTHTELAGKIQKYVTQHIAEATFQQFISLFESFFFDLLRLWLTTFPKNLIGKKVDFKSILEAPDKDAIVQLAVGKELNEVLYDRPAEWFEYLNSKVNLGCPTESEIERIAEAKASRDVLVHNRGVASETYEKKAGKLARYKDGDSIHIPESYHRQTWELIRKVVSDISNAAIAKAP